MPTGFSVYAVEAMGASGSRVAFEKRWTSPDSGQPDWRGQAFHVPTDGVYLLSVTFDRYHLPTSDYSVESVVVEIRRNGEGFALPIQAHAPEGDRQQAGAASGAIELAAGDEIEAYARVHHDSSDFRIRNVNFSGLLVP